MFSWKKNIDIKSLNNQSKNTMMEYLDIKIIKIGDDYIVASMPYSNRTKQPFGLLHGGASVTLAESVASMAANLCVDEAHYAVGLEINANHIKAVLKGTVIATARPIHVGNKTQVWGIDIENNGKLTCISRLTVAVLKK